MARVNKFNGWSRLSNLVRVYLAALKFIKLKVIQREKDMIGLMHFGNTFTKFSPVFQRDLNIPDVNFVDAIEKEIKFVNSNIDYEIQPIKPTGV